MLLLVSIKSAKRSGRSDSAVNCWMNCGFFFDQLEIVHSEVGNETALLVRDGKEDIDLGDAAAEPGFGLAGISLGRRRNRHGGLRP